MQHSVSLQLQYLFLPINSYVHVALVLIFTFVTQTKHIRILCTGPGVSVSTQQVGPGN